MINVTKSSMPSFEEYCEEIKDLFESHWLTNMGVKHQKLQSELEEYLDADSVVLFANGHLALENSIKSFDFPEGGEIITTPFTFASTTHAIVRSGLAPIFCDIKKDDYTIDPEKIPQLINDKTCAILPVHVYGNICEVEKIAEIADEYGLKVIYDAAHAFGVKYKNESVANFGDISMYSFHATKVFNTIEGGAACLKDPDRVRILNEMKNFGIKNEEEVTFIGGNAKMNEFSAAMGICNLMHIDEEISKRKAVYEHYIERLDGAKGIVLCKIPDYVKSNYSYFPIVLENYKYTRNELIHRLRLQGINARKYFYPLTNSFSCYKSFPNANIADTPIAQQIALRVLTLPLYADLSLEDVDRICDIILE